MLKVFRKGKLVGFIDCEVAGVGVRVPVCVGDNVFRTVRFKYNLSPDGEVFIRAGSVSRLNLLRQMENYYENKTTQEIGVPMKKQTKIELINTLTKLKAETGRTITNLRTQAEISASNAAELARRNDILLKQNSLYLDEIEGQKKHINILEAKVADFEGRSNIIPPQVIETRVQDMMIKMAEDQRKTLDKHLINISKMFLATLADRELNIRKRKKQKAKKRK